MPSLAASLPADVLVGTIFGRPDVRISDVVGAMLVDRASASSLDEVLARLLESGSEASTDELVARLPTERLARIVQLVDARILQRRLVIERPRQPVGLVRLAAVRGLYVPTPSAADACLVRFLVAPTQHDLLSLVLDALLRADAPLLRVLMRHRAESRLALPHEALASALLHCVMHGQDARRAIETLRAARCLDQPSWFALGVDAVTFRALLDVCGKDALPDAAVLAARGSLLATHLPSDAVIRAYRRCRVPPDPEAVVSTVRAFGCAKLARVALSMLSSRSMRAAVLGKRELQRRMAPPPTSPKKKKLLQRPDRVCCCC